MQTKRILGHSDNEQTVRSILDSVEAMIRASQLSVEYEEYQDSPRIEGRPFKTGKNTLTIRLDGGSPEVEIKVDYGGCCGD